MSGGKQMSDLTKIFNYNGKQVRTVQLPNSKIGFVAKDVCESLDIVWKGSQVLANIKDAHKGVTRLVTPGGDQEIWYVDEPGLYKLVSRSNKEEAEKFQDWIYEDVLPAIRKHGMYATDDLLNDPDLAIKAFTALKEERARNQQLALENAQKTQIIHELQPKATYYDFILQTKAAISVNQIAKDYGMSARQLNNLLHDFKVQYKEGGIWLLYRDHAPMGYTSSKTHNYTNSRNEQCSKLHTYWTQKGRLFIYDLLKQHSILPMIEREGLRLVSNK
jgi:prophage antirepressor-like protein